MVQILFAQKKEKNASTCTCGTIALQSFHFSLAKVKEPGRVWSEARERRKDKTLCPVDDDDAMLVTEIMIDEFVNYSTP